MTEILDPPTLESLWEEAHVPPSRGWMVIFTDLVALMLTFFVLLFSMSNVQVDRWDRMIDTLSRSLNPTREKPEVSVVAQYNISTVFRKRAVNIEYLAAVLKETMGKDDVLTRARLILQEDRLIIALPGDLLFGQGSAVLSDRARDALFGLGGVLRNVGNQIGVDGHSDPGLPAESTYKTTWELSLARAVAVANTLRGTGYPYDIIAFGHGDSRFADLPPVPDAERRAMARRVDILVFSIVEGG